LTKLAHIVDALRLSFPILRSLLFTGGGTHILLCPIQERWKELRKILLLATIAAAMLVAFVYGCQSDKQGGSGSSKTKTKAQNAEQTQQAPSGGSGEAQGGLGPKVENIMDSKLYRYGQWGYLEVDPSNGSTVRSLGPADRLYIPGSSTKLFSVSATLDELGFDHRFKTPVYAQGRVKNGKLSGDLVLVASGDLTMGGRTAPDGTVSYTPVDHTYANSVPGATLTPENPLARLEEIAKQVRKSGIKGVDGNVVIDDRLFELAPKGPSVDALSFNAPTSIPGRGRSP
jgi:D-alanyl-D-alanine carboxypeptidase